VKFRIEFVESRSAELVKDGNSVTVMLESVIVDSPGRDKLLGV
jgi:hypothetical protein